MIASDNPVGDLIVTCSLNSYLTISDFALRFQSGCTSLNSEDAV